MTTTKSYDNLNRLLAISNTPSADSVISYNYAYNNANQRTAVTNTDNSRWAYQYDNLGQATSGKKYWSDAVPVAGQQFEYGFDDIGNRKYAASGGDQWGSNLRYQNYSANNLNQYTQRTVPGAVDIIGAAATNATVTVNNRPSYRKGDYFRDEYPMTNGGASVYQSLTNLAVLNNGTNADITTTNIGNLFLPQTPEAFSYDPDGNLTNDGRWAYIWDAENRLLSMISSTVTDAAKKKLEFNYDYMARRIEKKVSNWSGGTWQLSYDNRFMYDGWNLLAELNVTNNSVINGCLWGVDVSGSLRGAGGVGGLLVFTSIGNGVHFAAYDGNGNMAAFVTAAGGTNSAQYEYSPFGELLRASGAMAKANPLRFSTKYQDDETDLLYYGRRYYNPSTGRWISRDPVGKRGGLNLYSNSKNDVINNHDVLGLFPGPGWNTCYPGLILSMGPWSKYAVEPSADWDPRTLSSDSVTIVYVHTVTQNFLCPCTCPPNTRLVTKAVNHYMTVNADNERGAILWSAGPIGPWPPLDIVEAAIEIINDHLHEPTPSGASNAQIVASLISENMPGPTAIGTMRSKDLPKRWCIWK